MKARYLDTRNFRALLLNLRQLVHSTHRAVAVQLQENGEEPHDRDEAREFLVAYFEKLIPGSNVDVTWEPAGDFLAQLVAAVPGGCSA